MLNAYKQFWTHYFDFTGHTHRKDFWLASLLNTIIYLISTIPSLIVLSTIYSSGNVPTQLPTSGLIALIVAGIGALYGLAALVPTYAINVRRLRDVGFHWALIFIWVIPYIGTLVSIILLLLPTNFYPLKKQKNA